MSPFPDFDLATTPLPPGRILLEASAGTGKTYSITGIAIRLIAIEGITIDEMLLVTFTEAATRELRDRVRKRLTGVALALMQQEDEDPATQAILASGVPVEEAIKRLTKAITCFDEACISTIHGFCQRLLKDHAFESGAAFDADVVSDPRDLQLDLAMDYWRKHFYRAGKLSAAIADTTKPRQPPKTYPEYLAELLGRLSRQPDLRILPETVESFAEAESQAECAYDTCMELWSLAGAEIIELLNDCLKQKQISKDKKKGLPESKLRELTDTLNFAQSSETPTREVVEGLCALSESALADVMNRNNTPPLHPFFTRCETFSESIYAWEQALRRDWLDFASTEFAKAKAARRIMTFDDMLTQVRDALQGPRGSDLAQLTGERFRAALIDEFQDTDPLQYEIFSRIFNRPKHRLMFIGDPKQSIYGFRGADLFTYLKAKKEIQQESTPKIYTLRQNYRSEAGLVSAVNTLFSASPECFRQEGIDFFPSEARSKEAEENRFLGPPDAKSEPLQFVQLPEINPETGKAFTKGIAESWICQHVAGEIQRLLTGDNKLGERTVRPGDIAVLVRDRFQAAAIHQNLNKLRIPNVRHTEESVFKTTEAEDLMRVFVAILEPTYERLLKAALSTCFFGLNANQLHQLQSDEIAWNSRIEQFIDLRRLWANHGFVNAFRKLTVDEHLRPRIVQTASGERKLTNLLHLAELIHDAERENRFTPAGLIQWIRHQMEEMRTPSEAQFLRLERDEDAVQVVTVHKAKGLQYGIVFCPFHWTGKKSRETLFHDRNNENRLTLDLSGKEVNSDHNAQADEENLAEEIRLLYVGVTRAINRCYLYVAGIANKNPSPLEAVLVEESTFQDSLEKIVAQNPENIGLSTLHHVSGDSAPTPGNAEPVQELAWRAFSRKLPREGMVASFSGLTHTVSVDSSHQAIDPKDRDESEFISPLWNEGEKAPDYSIFGFPRGTAAGNALHAILEVADFANPSELPGQVQKALKAEGLDPAYAPAVIKQLHMLFQHPLNRGQDRFSLSQLGAGDRLTEVEFFFPIRRFWPSDLAHAYRLHPLPELPRQIDRLHFNPTDGYLRGFIDLIFRYQDRFYIADWKSNWLGDKTADYTPDKLSAAMVESSYHLQSHLYAVALDQYLSSRLPGYQFSKNFGGIVYFFIRGLDPEAPERGVHFESVDPQFLTGLKKQILRNTQVAQ